MTQIPAGFEDFMARHGYTFAVIGNVLTGEKIFVGDRSSLESDYIVRNHFDYMSVVQINECFMNRLMPAMVAQGIVCGVLCKPREDVFVGLFRNDRRSMNDQIDSSEQADQELRELWRSPDAVVAQ